MSLGDPSTMCSCPEVLCVHTHSEPLASAFVPAYWMVPLTFSQGSLCSLHCLTCQFLKTSLQSHPDMYRHLSMQWLYFLKVYESS